jgi:hypothetical protein
MSNLFDYTAFVVLGVFSLGVLGILGSTVYRLAGGDERKAGQCALIGLKACRWGFIAIPVILLTKFIWLAIFTGVHS